MAPKSQPLEPLDADKPIVEATAILDTLRSGLARIKTQIDSVEIEGHLGSLPKADPRAKKPRGIVPGGSRTDLLRARLQRNRALVPDEDKPDEPVSGALSPAVALALEVVNAARKAPAVFDRRALLEQLRRDEGAVERGVAAQQRAIETLRDARKYAQTVKDVDPLFTLHVRRYRAYAAAAAIDDEFRDFQKVRFDGGYGWRADLLPELAMRVMLTLGSERDFDSEISKMRQRLEEAKKL